MTASRINLRTTTPRPPGVAGRLGASLFFLAWLVIPGIMLVVMIRQSWTGVHTWTWPQVECTILESRVEEVGSDPDYVFAVRYQYVGPRTSAVDSPPWTGTVFAPNYRGDDDYAVAQRLALRYPAGTRATCYVNPGNPEEAVLNRGGARGIPMALFPLLFLAIGFGGLWFTWRAKPAPAGPAPISSSNTVAAAGAMARRGPWFLVVFFALFLGVGGAVLAVFGAKVLSAVAARSWQPVAATVVSSGVRSHTGGDSTTYSPNILYAYRVGGREYRSNRYGFMGGSSGGYDAKREIVRRFPPGKSFAAYVNPADPTDAVIERGFTKDMWVVLVPLVFTIVGVVGVFFSARAGIRARRDACGGESFPRALRPPPAGRYVTPSRTTSAAGPPVAITLSPRQSPGLRFFGLTFMAVLWNGIVSVFLFHVVKSWSTGRGEVCMTVVLVPFVVIGVGIIVGALHALLAVFNPRCTLTLQRGEPALGDTAEVRWEFTGRYDRIQRLVVRVEAREEATYRQGTSTSTDKNVFLVMDVIDTSRAVDIRAGKARVAIPADTMHSFTAPNNKIVWSVIVHGHIAGWPDVKDDYAIIVRPFPGKSAPPTHAEDVEQPHPDTPDTDQPDSAISETPWTT